MLSKKSTPSSNSSFTEKNEEWRLQDQEVAGQQPKEYEPIIDEPLETAKVDQNLQDSQQQNIRNDNADEEKLNSRGNLSRLQSSTSGVSSFSMELSSTKSTTVVRKKWYKRLNPLKGGKRPPVPETREVSAEYRAGLLSRLTFQWIAPLMVVSSTIHSLGSRKDSYVLFM